VKKFLLALAAAGLVAGAGLSGGSVLARTAKRASAAKMVKTASGLQYVDLVKGKGPMPKRGQTVKVHYTGWLKSGKKFDSSRDRAQPFDFVLGQGMVIPGWDEGVATMRVGGRRKLVIPSKLGYGPFGYPPTIPGDATLTFDVELLGAQ
jgi:peptidylprolyl isomerase